MSRPGSRLSLTARLKKRGGEGGGGGGGSHFFSRFFSGVQQLVQQWRLCRFRFIALWKRVGSWNEIWKVDLRAADKLTVNALMGTCWGYCLLVPTNNMSNQSAVGLRGGPCWQHATKGRSLIVRRGESPSCNKQQKRARRQSQMIRLEPLLCRLT